MPNFWNVADGVLLFGRYRIERTLEQTAERAFFVVEPEKPGARGALAEAVRASAPGAEAQFHSWELGSRLSHPNLIRILETGRDRLEGEAVLYAIMEYPEEHLSDVLNGRPLTAEEARQVAASITETLAYLHKSGIVHANLRAAEVAADQERIKIPVDRVLRNGSPAPDADACAPPEWGRGTVSPAGDIWALGVLLHEALTRRLPSFDGEGRPQLEGIDAELAEVIRGCLRPDPERRWTAGQVKRYLEGGGPPREAPTPIAAPAPVQPPVPHASGGRHWMLLGVAALIVLAVVWVVRQPKTPPVQTPSAPTAAVPVPAPPPVVAPPPKAVAPPPQRAATGAWRVIVYTFNARKPAEQKAAAINKRFANLDAEVFHPGGRGPYLIAVGGRMSRAEAERLERRVRSMGLPRDSFARNFKE